MEHVSQLAAETKVWGLGDRQYNAVRGRHSARPNTYLPRQEPELKSC
jgi:hypothetical protein